MDRLESRIAAYRSRIERVLDGCLARPFPATGRLCEAMRYSVLGGGKRLRPTLVYLTGEALGAPLERLDAPAAAVELIHVYSLVHDDLPAMDDDDLRRGRPTCHRAFDEATAILVGDALQALAFEVLANASAPDAGAAGGIAASGASASQAPADATPAGGAPAGVADGSTFAARLAMVRILARAAGTGGMAGGQAIDLASVGQRLTLEQLENMHRRKTGALIEGSVLLGACAAGIEAGPQFTALRRFGADIGLAFQIQDDILDVAGDPRELGKTTGADDARRKPTYPSTLGLQAARQRARDLCDNAVTALAPFGERAGALADLARYVVSRTC